MMQMMLHKQRSNRGVELGENIPNSGGALTVQAEDNSSSISLTLTGSNYTQAVADLASAEVI